MPIIGIWASPEFLCSDCGARIGIMYSPEGNVYWPIVVLMDGSRLCGLCFVRYCKGHTYGDGYVEGSEV